MTWAKPSRVRHINPVSGREKGREQGGGGMDKETSREDDEKEDEEALQAS